MTMKNKVEVEVDLLQAHYSGLEQRLEEVESRVELLNSGIDTIVGGSDLRWDQFKNKLRLVREDRTPIPRSRNKGKQ